MALKLILFKEEYIVPHNSFVKFLGWSMSSSNFGFADRRNHDPSL